MSTSRTSGFRRSNHDHFEPEVDSDPTAQRRLRGQLEHIDYTVFASNREVISHVLGHADAAKFQRLAVAAAHARATWVAESMAMTETAHVLSAEQVAKLTRLRTAFEELSDVYEAARRMIERGYLPFHSVATR
jgi:hypothetical protein